MNPDVVGNIDSGRLAERIRRGTEDVTEGRFKVVPQCGERRGRVGGTLRGIFQRGSFTTAARALSVGADAGAHNVSSRGSCGP